MLTTTTEYFEKLRQHILSRLDTEILEYVEVDEYLDTTVFDVYGGFNTRSEKT